MSLALSYLYQKYQKMFTKTAFLTFFIGLTLLSQAQPAFQLENFATGFDNPVDIAHAGDDRLFIVEREGYIKITDLDGNVFPADFLDIHTLIESGYQEQGLLGLAFHPNYADNGYFYVHYTDNDGNSVVSRFSVSTFNADLADPTTELILFTADQPFVNHNGGCIKFGPDGYLYIGLGDGGSAGDPGDRAQNPENRLGKMHRIDVDGGSPYAIPADNPFATATDTLPEIWAIGYRNPWRFSFDRLNGNMWVGDVGQNLQEEIDVELAGDGGHNYGWRCYEGFDEFNDSGCDDDVSSYTMPILQYPHNFTTGGFSVTGGFVYRGTEYPGMYGYYMFADYVSGNWWWVNADAGAPYIYERVDDVEADIAVFGEDVNGELYAGDLAAGIIYRITDACGSFNLTATDIDYTCGAGLGAIDLNIIDGLAPYEIEWSNGAVTEDISDLIAGTYIAEVTDAAGCKRTEVVVITETPAFEVTITQAGNTLTATGGSSWQWYLNGVVIDGAVSNTYTITESGDYSVIATDGNDCTSESDVINLILPTSEFEKNTLQIYPNPVNNQLFIQSDICKAGDMIQIINQLGETVLSVACTYTFMQIDVSALSAGMYLVKWQSNNQSATQSVVVID